MQLLALKDKLDKLPYFTKQNLGLVLGKDGDALDYWIKKLIKNKVLIPLKKGMYASSFYLDMMKERGEMERYLEYLAGIIRYPSYISLEYALAKYGLIPEAVYSLTSITSKTTRSYRSQLTTFSYRNIKEELFMGFTEERYGGRKIVIATAAKALFDYLYLKKFSSLAQMKDYLLTEGRLNWQGLSKDDKKLFKNYVVRSRSKKMLKILEILQMNKLV